MNTIVFRRGGPNEAAIIVDGERVGELYRQDDILCPGGQFYVAHLDEDPRGPVRIDRRSRVRHVVESMVRGHPLW